MSASPRSIAISARRRISASSSIAWIAWRPIATESNAMSDARFMRAALALARRGLGRTWPNPSVGCLIVKDGTVVGRGWTQPGGRPHAEVEALARAGRNAKGADAYVTLEPCCHHGKKIGRAHV